MTTAKTWIVTTFAISLFCMAAEPLAAQQDPTGGVDESNIFTSKSLLEIIRNGGPMMIPIGIASILLLVFVFERITSLRRGRIIPRHFVKLFLTQLREGKLNQKKAVRVCKENPSVISSIFSAASQKWGRPSVEVEQAVLDEGERVTYKLKKHLRLINGIATVTPLLGLLGTVVGMIVAFDAIGASSTSSDPKLLIANGISQALLTTAAGMSVAIPALIAYIYFVGLVDRLIVEIDSLGQKVVAHVAGDGVVFEENEDFEEDEDANTGSSRSRNRSKKAA
ncbi:MAG: MotA/TolQ/ExbB proton channel family protein [Planctomycetota bacterium]|nr:MotA/TolQ/ExbB proton channel family protein [Planctomycetota bacterium]